MQDRKQLIQEIAQVVLDSVNITHIKPEELKAETALMQGELELDSVDVLEAVVAIEHHFNVRVQNAEEGRKHFSTFGSIADFIGSQATP